jgi:hypothetical protein
VLSGSEAPLELLVLNRDDAQSNAIFCMHETHKNYDITNSVDTSELKDPKLHSVMLYVHNICCRFPCLAFTLFVTGLQNKFHVWTGIDSDLNQTFPVVKLQGVVSIANWAAHYRISNIKSPHEVDFISVFGSCVIPNRSSNQQGFWFTF